MWRFGLRLGSFIRRNFVLAVWLALSLSGCDSVTVVDPGLSSDESGPVGKSTWGLAKSEELQEHLCDAEGAFSARIHFANGVPNVLREIHERILCGLPRPRTEPKDFDVYGKIIGTAFARAGNIVRQCEIEPATLSAGNQSEFFTNTLNCSDPIVDADETWPAPSAETISIYLQEYLDSNGTIRSLELNSEIARVDGLDVVRLIVPPGTFRTDEPIRSDVSIILEGAGIGSSTIIGTDSGMRSILEVYPRYDEVLELSATAVHGSEILYVNGTPQTRWQNECSRIVIRDTSQIWPWDARDYVFFGELANVVEAHPGLIVLSEPTSDTYFGGSEVSFICPSGVVVRDISLEFANPVLGTKALAISGGDPITVSNVEIANTGRVAVWIAESANVLVSDNFLRNGFPPDCDTCYGVQTYGAQDVVLQNNHIMGFRRAIDISGTIPSRRVMVRNNQILVESDTSRAASGMGTHGSADGVIFADNDVTGGIVSVLLRGDNIQVSNNRLLDAEYSSVYLDSGGTHYVIANQLGGIRATGRPTTRGVEFHVTTGHVYSQILNNLVSAAVGVRVAQTPAQIDIVSNMMANGGVPVLIEEGVVLDDDDTVEFEW